MISEPPASQRLVFALLIGLLGLCYTSLGWAQESATSVNEERAFEYYEEAIEAYKNNDKDKAISFMEQAFELDPNGVLAYNIAKTYDDLGEWSAATEWFQKALDFEDLNEREKQKVKTALERIARTEAEMLELVDELLPTEARLSIEANIRAQVSINGFLVGNTPYSTVFEPGHYQLLVEAEGFESFSQDVTLEAGDSLRVVASLEPDNLLPWVYLTGGIGLVGIGLGVAGDVLAFQAYDDAAASRLNPTRLSDKKNLGENMRIMAITGYAVGGVALASSLILLLLDDEPALYEVFDQELSGIDISATSEGAALQASWHF